MKLHPRDLILSALAVPVLLLLLYVRTARFDFAEHKQFDRQLGELSELDTTLNQDMLKLRFRLLTDYDSIGAQLRALQQTVGVLAVMPSFVARENQAEFRVKLAEFSKLLARKEELLESFKSGNAVLSNSLRYMPVASTDLLGHLALDAGSSGLKAQVNELMLRVLVYCLSPGEDEAPALRQSLESLNAWRAENPAYAQARALGAVAAHVRSILTRKPKIEELTQAVLALPTAERADELRRLYDVQLAQVLHAAERSRKVLWAGCALLLVGIGYAFYAMESAKRKLVRLNASIERQVEERTAALAQALGGLQASEQRFRMLSASAPIGIFETDPDGSGVYTNAEWEKTSGLSAAESLGEGWKRAIHPDDAPRVFKDWKAAVELKQDFDGEFRFIKPGGEVRWVHVRSAALHSEAGAVVGHVGTTEDITERKRADAFLKSVLQNLPITVFIKEAQELRFVLWNKAGEEITGISNAEMEGKNDYDFFPKEQAESFVAKDREALRSRKLVELEEPLQTRHRGVRIMHTRKIPILDGNGQPLYLLGISEDITERKAAAAELEKMHGQLLDTSRQAGMAEVATAVLHNVGNVLNSVNVAAMCVAETLRKSKAGSLARVVTLLREQEADLGAFFARDARAKKLPEFLAQLSTQLAAEQAAGLQELAHLQKNVEHIKDIVAMQQNYAKVSGVTETVQIAELLEDTLRMNEESFAHHAVRVERDFAEVPPLTVEKHKVVQILVNLVRNAKHACDAADRPDKTMTLRVFNGGGSVKVSVSDNGVGIAPENLARIFNHGFTTKKDGHGFGLHSGALAAQEMGGALRVESAGAGLGATFTLELPTAAASQSTASAS